MSEEFKAMKELVKERHNKWFEKNMETIHKDNLMYRKASQSCLVFGLKDSTVSFYPHTGRWRHKNKTFRGGATSFLQWYKKLLGGTREN